MVDLTFAKLTTMRVGGTAKQFIVVENKLELIAKANELLAFDEPWMVLGGGSNTIVSDEGFPGTVLLIKTSGITEVADQDIDASKVRIRVEAGHNWDELVTATLNQGFLGLEALSGIPGACGAAPIQNIGAYGSELKDVLHSIEFLNSHTGEIENIAAVDLGLGYRDSAIKRQEIEGIVLSIDLVLDKSLTGANGLTTIKHEQLARALKTQIGAEISALQVRESVLELRKAKGMVLDENDQDSWSSGSFFMNPIVSTRFARSLPKEAPRYDLVKRDSTPLVLPLEKLHIVDQLQPVNLERDEQFTKISAAWLIENAGISKGFRLPGSGAAISDKHTLAITNRGAANANDVAELARYVIARVRSEFGVILVPEPNLYGITL